MLRTLIIEDVAADAELMVNGLRRAGFDPVWQRVEIEEDYLAQLRTVPDVILADHTLPQSGAQRALELLKKSGLDIPLIVITGSIRSPQALQMWATALIRLRPKVMCNGKHFQPKKFV